MKTTIEISEKIDGFFSLRIGHRFCLLERAGDSAFLFMDESNEKYPFVLLTSEGITQFPYRDVAQKRFQRARKESLVDEDFVVCCRNNEGVELGFDVGVDYVAKFGDEKGTLMVWDRYGKETRCFESRFDLPVGYLIFGRILERGAWDVQQECPKNPGGLTWPSVPCR